MTTNPNAKRYQRLSKREMDTIAASLSPRVMRYVIRGKLVDTWRIRFLMQIAARGARMSADPKDIEKAMLDWLRAPSRDSLEQAERDIAVAGMGYDDSAKHAGLSADELEEMHTNLATFGGDAEALMYDPQTYREIRSSGGRRGMDNIYKRGIGRSFGLPENALLGRDARRLLDQIAEIQEEGFDSFLPRPEFWDDLNKVDQGRMSREEFLDRWMNGDPRLPPLIPLPKPETATAKPKPKPKPKPNSKTRPKPLVLDPLVIRGRTIVRTEPVVWFDEEKKHPMIIKAYYNDGTTRIFVLDSSGQFISCQDELLPMSRGNKVQPMTIIRRGKCAVLPADGGLKRPPGPVRGN